LAGTGHGASPKGQQKKRTRRGKGTKEGEGDSDPNVVLTKRGRNDSSAGGWTGRENAHERRTSSKMKESRRGSRDGKKEYIGIKGNRWGAVKTYVDEGWYQAKNRATP